MGNLSKTFAALAVTAALSSCANVPQTIDEQVDALYNRMSQEERIAQLHGLYMTQFFDENDKLIVDLCI